MKLGRVTLVLFNNKRFSLNYEFSQRWCGMVLLVRNIIPFSVFHPWVSHLNENYNRLFDHTICNCNIPLSNKITIMNCDIYFCVDLYILTFIKLDSYKCQ